jgi:hypothetical protein
MSTPQEWSDLLEELNDYVTPDWLKHANDHGEQPWVRLVLLVDVQNQLLNPFATEKVAQTMADLAVDRPSEMQGWEMLIAKTKEHREALITRIFDTAEKVLPPELLPLYTRAAEPARYMGGGA